MDIKERLDSSFGDGPVQPPADDHLVAGRRALRRHRVTSGVAALAVATLVGGGTWLALPSGQADNPDDQAVMSQPSNGASTTTTPLDELEDHIIFRTRAPNAEERGGVITVEPLAFAEDGKTLLVPKGITVDRRLDRRLDRHTPTVSAVITAKDGTKSQVFVTPESTLWVPFDPSRDFESWTQAQVDEALEDLEQAGEEGMPSSVEGSSYVEIVTPGAPLEPASESTILDQQRNPDLPDNFAKASDASWVAQVRDRDGAEWFILVRRVNGVDDYIGIPSKDAGNPTSLDAFVEWARGRYDSGVGVR